MKNAIFEVATLADAIAKANRVAPTKGASFDKAAGIVIDVNPAVNDAIVVRSTDLQVTIRIVVNYLEIGDEAATWRCPARLIHGLLASLPPASGSTIELRDTGDGYLYMKCGKTKGKLLQIVGSYPLVATFDAHGMETATSLSDRLSQVAWATDKRGTGVLSGVHLDGEYLYGFDRANMAMVPCKVPLVEPITAPLSEIAAIIKNTGEVQVRATQYRFEIMPDPHTQASCVLYEEPYPKLRALVERSLAKLQATDTPSTKIQMDSESLLGMIDRTLVLMKDERLESTIIEIGETYFKMIMTTGAGTVIDEVEITGGGTDPFRVSFSPETLRSAVMASGRPVVSLTYGPTPKDPVQVTDDQNFVALMMPRAI